MINKNIKRVRNLKATISLYQSNLKQLFHSTRSPKKLLFPRQFIQFIKIELHKSIESYETEMNPLEII